MSIPAQKWAMEQAEISSGAKFILLVLATYADVTGGCWPSHKKLSGDTNQSLSTVQRSLRDLERRGLIYIGPRRIDDDGHAGACQYFLLHDSWSRKYALQNGFDPDEIARKYASTRRDEESAQDHDDSESLTGQNDRSGENGFVENQIVGEKANENRSVKMTDQEMPAQIGQIDRSADRSLVTDEQPINNPPLKSPHLSPAVALDEGSWLTDWKRFEDLWPWTGDEARDRVRRKFRDLPPETRVDVLAGAEAYLADRRVRKAKVCSARSFLADGIFKNWTKAGRELAAHGGDRKIGEPVFVRKGSDAWEAWKRAKGGKSMPAIRKVIEGRSVEGWYFPTLFPRGVGAASAGPEPPERASG